MIKKMLMLAIFLLNGCGYLSTKVGVIKIKGVIADADDIIKQIDIFINDADVKGIMVFINSPGGGVGASQEIYYALKRAKSKGKKIVVYMQGIAASGGYYVSLPANKIVAAPGTITGSIGVIMEYPVVKKLFDKIGIDYVVIKSKPHKDIASPFRYPDDDEKMLLKNTILDVYDQFITDVADNRGIPKDSVEKIADGRVITGRQAKEYGLIDATGGRDVAIDIMKKVLNLNVDDKIELIEIKKKKSLVEFLMENAVNRFVLPKIEYRFRLPE